MRQPQAISFPKRDPIVSAVGQEQVSRNGHGRKDSDKADARYAAALKLVQVIDYNLRKGTRHYYDSRGRLLSSLDQVIHAILTDSLALGRPAERPRSKETVQWMPVGELAA